jgi:hypothetical protein
VEKYHLGLQGDMAEKDMGHPQIRGEGLQVSAIVEV